jgi:hypothetical protein
MPETHGSRAVALDALKRVVEGCVAGMGDLPALLEERAVTTQAAYRAQIVPMLGANAVAQRVAYEQAGVLRTALPDAAQADVGVEYLQGLSEGLALLAQDAGDPLIPDQEDLARWTADPQLLRWLQCTSGAVPGDVLAWADAAEDQLLTPCAGVERTVRADRVLRAELLELPIGYRALADAYAGPRTRAVASEAAWDRLVALARTLRELKGPSCRLIQFDARAVRSAFAVLHQVFASLALIAHGAEPARMLLAPDAVDRHAAACAS